MALQTKTIKQNIKAVGNIKKMTKTMQMVSVAKMRKATDLAKRGRVYAHHTQLLASRLARRTGFVHPIFSDKREGGTLYIIASSDKGLCGAYNTRIDALYRNIAAENGAGDVIALGKKAIKTAKRYKGNVITSFEKLNDEGDYDVARAVATEALKAFLDGTYARVYVITTSYVSSFDMHAQKRTLLPLSPDMMATPQEDTSTVPYNLEQSEDSLMDFIVPELLTEILFGLLKEAKASEHSSRMIAMQNATDSADKVQKELVRDYNRARQAAVTQEITEITNAANAV